ncbi:hypothetical protein OIU76_026526 [Salix suchowensis]|nr:hypothetical protein OIU76_026526 [Salix suchowensis]
MDGGLTVFCPLDDPFKAFSPRFKNLTASGKVSFLEFFGVPVYQSLAMLRSNNGIMNTLATDGEKNSTGSGSLAPEKEVADAPKSSKHKKPSSDAAPSDSPADSPDGDPADQTADDNASVTLHGGKTCCYGIEPVLRAFAAVSSFKLKIF